MNIGEIIGQAIDLAMTRDGYRPDLLLVPVHYKEAMIRDALEVTRAASAFSADMVDITRCEGCDIIWIECDRADILAFRTSKFNRRSLACAGGK